MSSDLIIQEFVRGIPVYRFHKNNRQAVDAYLDIAIPYLKHHIETKGVDVPYCFALDVSKPGMYSISYMIGQLRERFTEFDKKPRDYIAFIAVNTTDEILVRMLDSLTSEMAHTRRVFTPDQFDLAIDWLISMQKS